jgi:hypothetical protein
MPNSRLWQRLKREFTPTAVWVVLFLVSLSALLWISTPTFGPGRTFLWLLFSALGSVAGYGIIYEIVISHGYLFDMRKTVSEAMERALLLTMFSRHSDIEADIYVNISTPRKEILDASHRSLVRVAISKRFTARLEDQVQIIFCRDEMQPSRLLQEVQTIFVWSFGVPENGWPPDVPLLEVTHLNIDGVDLTNRLREIENGVNLIRYICDIQKSNDLRLIQVDVCTFQPADSERITTEIYLPSADIVRCRFDASRLGFNKAWMEGQNLVQRPFFHGPEGAGTVEAFVLKPAHRQHVSVIATREIVQQGSEET